MRVDRTEWHDWYVDGEGSAVFVAGNVFVLSALATAVLTRVDGPTELGTVAEHLEGVFGAPAGGDLLGATEAVVRELVGRGILAEA